MWKFNLNSTMLVKLRPNGYAYWRQRDAENLVTHSLDWYKAKADKDGYVAFKCWQFMEIFGGCITISRRPLFYPDVIIKTTDLRFIKGAAAPIDDMLG